MVQMGRDGENLKRKAQNSGSPLAQALSLSFLSLARFLSCARSSASVKSFLSFFCFTTFLDLSARSGNPTKDYGGNWRFLGTRCLHHARCLHLDRGKPTMQLAKLRLHLFGCHYKFAGCYAADRSNSVHEVQGQRNALRRLFSNLKPPTLSTLNATTRLRRAWFTSNPTGRCFDALVGGLAAFVIEDIATYSVIDYRIQLAVPLAKVGNLRGHGCEERIE